MSDISKHFKYDPYDSKVGKELLKLEGKPEAIMHFDKVHEKLTNYGYWFLLSTLWVKYTGFSSLETWKRLFSSDRPIRKTCIMKPSEIVEFDKLPYDITVYRAHRENEVDWISYTTDMYIAGRFAMERDLPTISEYKVKKTDVIAYFLRRGEKEIIMLDKDKAEFVREILVADEGDSIKFYG